MKTLKKILLFIACIGIVFVFPVGTAEAVTNDSIREKEAEIATAKEEVANLKSNLTDVEALKKELEQSKNDLTAYVTQLDTQLSDIQSKIDEYNNLITTKESEIETTTEELNDAIAKQEEQYEAMKLRIQFMYEQGDSLYMEILFSSNSIADTINKADYIESFSAYDSNQLDEYVKTREMISLSKE